MQGLIDLVDAVMYRTEFAQFLDAASVSGSLEDSVFHICENCNEPITFYDNEWRHVTGSIYCAKKRGLPRGREARPKGGV